MSSELKFLYGYAGIRSFVEIPQVGSDKGFGFCKV